MLLFTEYHRMNQVARPTVTHPNNFQPYVLHIVESMERWQMDHIRSNLPTLIKVTKCNAELLSRLVACELLCWQEQETIEAKPTNWEKASKLYECARCRMDAYDKLLKCLRDCGQTEPYDILTSHTQYIPAASEKSAQNEVGNQICRDAEFVQASTALLKTNMSKLLADTSSADLRIMCSDGVELTAHKLILSAQNPVFAAMLSTKMKESQTGILKVDDISSSTMKILLRYLYTGDLLAAWRKPENVIEFTYASGKYQLTEVLKMLDKELGKDEAGDSNMQLLELANKLALKNAENRLLVLARSVLSTEQLLNLQKVSKNQE